MSAIATYTFESTGTRFSFWMSLVFCTFRKVPFASKTDKDSSVIRHCHISLKFPSPLFLTISVIAASPTLSMIPRATLSLPHVEVSFFSFAKVRRLFFGKEPKSGLTLVKRRFSKSFISFASPSTYAGLKCTISLSKAGIADWKVRRVGAAASKEKHSKLLTQFNRSCITCTSSFNLRGGDSVCLYTLFWYRYDDAQRCKCKLYNYNF